MKRLATIFSVLVATSTIAIAQPPPYGRGYDRGRYDVPHRGEVHSNWVLLTDDLPAAQGREDIALGERAGLFRRVFIKAERGRPYIRRVVVEFENGRREIVRVDRELYAGQGYAVDLPGDFRRIRHIAVMTAPDRHSRYAVYAM